MGKVVIFGSGPIAEVIWSYLGSESDHEVVGFSVDAEYLKTTSLFGLPVVPFEEIERTFPPDEHQMFVAIGYGKLNTLRTAKLAEVEARGYRAIGHVSPHAVVPPGFEPKPNSFIMEHNTIQPFAEIGRNVIVWSGNHIGHHSRIGDNCFVSSHVVVAGCVNIGENCFLGVNSTLRDNITLGSHVVVGAGALVLQDAPDYALFPGQGTEIAKIRSDRLRSL